MVSTLEPQTLYEIGTVARTLGVSPEVIRAWERRKLITPPRRTASGKRLFTDDDVAAMRRAREARLAATPLDAA